MAVQYIGSAPGLLRTIPASFADDADVADPAVAEPTDECWAYSGTDTDGIAVLSFAFVDSKGKQVPGGTADLYTYHVRPASAFGMTKRGVVTKDVEATALSLSADLQTPLISGLKHGVCLTNIVPPEVEGVTVTSLAICVQRTGVVAMAGTQGPAGPTGADGAAGPAGQDADNRYLLQAICTGGEAAPWAVVITPLGGAGKIVQVSAAPSETTTTDDSVTISLLNGAGLVVGPLIPDDGLVQLSLASGANNGAVTSVAVPDDPITAVAANAPLLVQAYGWLGTVAVTITIERTTT